MKELAIAIVVILSGIAMGVASETRQLIPVVLSSIWVGFVWWLVLKLDLPLATLSVGFSLLYEGSCLVTIWARGTSPSWYQILGGLMGIAGLALMSR